MKNKIAILGYHKIGPPPENGWSTWSYVDSDTFSSHLQYLNDHDWEVVDEKKLIAGLKNPGTLSEKTALITFDDGYKSNLEIALPLLKKFNYPAVIFIPVDCTGRYNSFDSDIFYEPVEPICSWEELHELENNRVSVQSHGLSHRKLSGLTMIEQEFEISESKKIIESRLSKNVELFSFPYGDTGSDLSFTEKILESAGYKAAVLYGGEVFECDGANLYALRRIPIGPDTDLHKLL